jgi:signal transduction histidine kinase
VVLLLLAVLVPAVCLLWFMQAAMRNERFAVRQKLIDVYRGQLTASQARLQQYWKKTAAQWEEWTETLPAPAAFAQCVRSGWVDSVVLLGEKEGIRYPNVPVAIKSDFNERDPAWQEASQIEHRHKYQEAAMRYQALGRLATNVTATARALQAEARCLLQAGQTQAVVQLVEERFGDERFRDVVDPQGRLVAANAELMALEITTQRDSPVFRNLAQRLAARVLDYENSAMASPQRRFLMKEVQRLSPEKMEFPTLAAEELAAEAILSKAESGKRKAEMTSSALPGVWQFITSHRRVMALLRSDRIRALTKTVLPPDTALADAAITLVPPDAEVPDAFVTLPAGEAMPGWRLALSLKDREFFNATVGRETAVYLWAGLLVVAVMGVLTVLTFRLLRRQMTLAQLKSDLAATVSHELKTPLSSMRVLVDTLLDSDQFDEEKAREYLQLIAQENERLGRLIQNFLAFSRMERKKYAFHFSLRPARQVIDAAVASMHGRLESPGCRFDLQVDDHLPLVKVDPDALATALINLLENAYKYSDENKHIVVRARAENGSVLFSVQDNGIGIAPRERKKIFQPFYQADPHLSRKGSGCGLGLSIVQFITTAHQGRVVVESPPGGGSTFTLSIPVASRAETTPAEVVS